MLLRREFPEVVDDPAAGRIFGGLRSKGFYKISQPGKPLVSVIIPVLNRAQSIEQAVKSVINQEYENVECIIIDGGSTDGTLNIIKNYDDRIDLWISEPDTGIYEAMNKGIAEAGGDWLYFLGSDDIMIDVLHRVVGQLRNPRGIYHGDIYRINKHRISGGEISARKIMRRNIPHQALFYPRSVFSKYRFELKYKVVADHHLNLLCFCDKEFEFIHLPLLVALFNDSGGLSSTTRDIAFDADLPKLVRKNLGNLMYCRFLVDRGLNLFEKKFIRRIAAKFKKPRD